MESWSLNIPDSTISHWFGLYYCSENRVRSWALFIHWCRTNMPILSSSLYDPNHILRSLNYFLKKTLNIHSFLDILSDMKIYRIWIKKIHDLLIVDFKITASNKEVELRVFSRIFNYLSLFFNAIKNIFEWPLHDTPLFMTKITILTLETSINLFFSIYNNTWTLNSEGLTSSCLTICKYWPIISL